MINQTIYDLLDFIVVGTYGLISFLVFILIIFVGVSNLKKELCPECKKGFSRLFVAFLIFLMFSTVSDFGYHLTYKIFYDQVDWSDSYSISYFYNTMNMIWGITFGLGFLNKLTAFLLLFISIEIYLINKKSKLKFLILAIILLAGTFIITIVRIALTYTIGGIGSAITTLVVGILTNLNYIILAIVILILLGKTSKESNSLKAYTKSVSSGVVFIFILYPIMQLLDVIRNFVSIMLLLNGINEHLYLFYWIAQGLFYLQSLMFIIGIIVLAVGSIKTLSVPLTFSRTKGAKGVQRQKVNTTTNSCPSCGAPLPPGAEFCTNCGNHL